MKRTQATPAEAALRFAAVVDAFAGERRLASIAADYTRRADGLRKSGFGANALKVNGKMFAMLVNDRLVVKLPRARVGELVAAEVGEPFDPGHGRLMKEWIAISADEPSWTALAKEAHDHVRGRAR
jgi:hypothetical protein